METDNWLENALTDLMMEWIELEDPRNDPDSDYYDWDMVPEYGEDYLD